MDGFPLRLLPQVIADLRGVHDHLSRLAGLDTPRLFVTEIMLAFAGIGLRQLEVARLCIQNGWGPESTAHARTAWECAIDAAFFLSHGGGDRQELAHLYFAIHFLRPPAQQSPFEGADRELIRAKNPAIIDLYDAAKAKYGKHKAVTDPRAHWSGLDLRRVVREKAWGFLEGLLDEEDKDLPRASHDAVFKVPSQLLHADPGVTQLLPLDPRNARVRIEPCPTSPAFEGAACVAGILLFLAVSQRGTPTQKSRRQPLMRELRWFLGLVQKPSGGAA